VTPAPRSTARRFLQATAGAALGLAAAEGAFWARDRGGFPHLNVYVADPALGVRLRPGAAQRFSLGTNPVTRVAIGPDGLRAGASGRAPAAPPPPSFAGGTPAGAVIVVGDSQVFGLGVEHEQTFSARLEPLLGRPVVNAGVPTYGPLEYLAVAEELMAKGNTSALVLTINIANDLFEASRPNAGRHAVWDGWAVRKELAPAAAPFAFPGRSVLFRDSHLAYAARGLWSRATQETGQEGGEASEGSFRDLLGLSGQRRDAEPGAHDRPERPPAPSSSDEIASGARASQARLEDLVSKAYPDLWKSKEAAEYRRSHGNPGDIVITKRAPLAEESRSPPRTIKELIKGAAIKKKVEADIRRRARRDRGDQGAEVLEALKERDKLRAREAAAGKPPPRRDEGGHADRADAADHAVQVESPLAPLFARAQAVCKQHGARLVVLVLPLDAQVSPGEMRKYGAEPVDTSETLALNADVVKAAHEAGGASLDATEALRAAEPGAFLDGDLHMTPKGHAAVAAALAAVLKAEPGR
jgi:hypothetical protein